MTLKIGIVAQDQPDSKFGVNANYLQFIYQFGHPIIILPSNAQDFNSFYKLDALVLPGGADVNPQRYSDVPVLGTYNPNNYLEHFDVKILPSLLGKLPIFGICRGLQTLNVIFGGTLRNLWWHPMSNYDSHDVHKIKIIYDDKKTTEFKVNSFHHQAIHVLADNFLIEAKSSAIDENVIEAISDYKNMIFAVQWHPERLLDTYSITKFESILR